MKKGRPSVKIENNNAFIRDVSNKAIINTDSNEKNRVLAARDKKRQETQRIESLENDVKDIKSSLDKILDILERHSK